MVANQQRRCLIHSLAIKGKRHRPGVPRPEGRGPGAVPDAIEVGAAARVAAGVEGVGHLLDLCDDNVLGQKRIEAALEAVDIGHCDTLECCHLPERVDSGVGPTSHA